MFVLCRAVGEILRRAGQLVDMKKDDGFAAIHLAALNGHYDVTETLMVTTLSSLTSLLRTVSTCQMWPI